MASILKVRASIDLGNIEAQIKIKKHFTVWQIKVLVFQEIAIKPHRQALFLPGKSNELDNAKMIKAYPALFDSSETVLNVKDRKLAGLAKKKKTEKRFRLFRNKKFKEMVAPKLCFANGRGITKALVGSLSQFTVYAVDKDFQPCAPKDLRIFEVIISNSNKDDHIPLEFESDERENVVVKWTPPSSGMYAINIRLYNEDILFSPYIVHVQDHEGSGSKLRSFLEDDEWRLEAISLLADWASQEDYHRSIFNEIGVPAIFAQVNAEPQEVVRHHLSRVIDGLLSNDTGMRRLVEEGGNEFFSTLATLSLYSGSLVILRFLTRAFASQASLLRQLSQDPDNNETDKFEELCFRFNKQFFGNLGMILRSCTDLQSIRNVTRATADLSSMERFRPVLGAAEFFRNCLSLVFGDDSQDLTSTKSLLSAIAAIHKSTDTTSLRYALQAIANFATDPTYRGTIFTEKHVTKLLGFLHLYTQDALVSGALKALAGLANDQTICAFIIQHSRFDDILTAVSGTDSFPDWEFDTTLKFLPEFAASKRDEYRRELVSRCRGDEEFNHSAMLLLNSIMRGSPEGEVRKKICSKDVIKNIVNFIMSINLDLQHEACGLAAQLCVYEDGRAAVIEAGGINALCTALNTGNSQTAAKVVEAFAEMPLEVKDVLVNVIGDSGIDKLINLLKVKELQRNVAILLASLAGDESCISRIVRKGGKQFMNQLIEVVRKGQVQVQTEIAPHEVHCDKVVGEGISGVVWKGTWREQEVAVKKFDEESIAFVDAEFRSEVALMSVLRHENIVHCMGSCTQPGNLFIVSELFTRGSVATVIKNKDVELPIQRVCQMSLDAAKGMRYLHRLGIIHRDLKPGNLLVNERWQVKVADFGVSRMSDSKMTRGVGTPVYTAPEALASSNYTQKADIYSFAFVIWEMLSREEPFLAYSPFEAVRLACEEDLRPEIPENCVLEGLIESCWGREAETRPSFDDIVAGLTEISNICAGTASGEALEEDDAHDRYLRANRVLTQMGTLRQGVKEAREKAKGRAGAPSKRASTHILPPPQASLRGSDKGTTARRKSFDKAAERRKLPSDPPDRHKSAEEAPQPTRPRSIQRTNTPEVTESIRAFAEGGKEKLDAGTEEKGVPASDKTMRPKGSRPTKKSARGGQSIRRLNKDTLREMIREQQLMKEEEAAAKREAEAAALKREDSGPSVTCERCTASLPKSRALNALGGFWHSQCFVCTKCGCALSKGWKSHEGKPYCGEHAPNVKRCAKCQLTLTGSYINAMNKPWHQDCFVCSRCNQSMDSFVDVGGQPVCATCMNIK